MNKINLNKSAQFGPDALVGMVLVAILGLGGIFFLNVFVNGLAMQGLISILDTEMDQRCYYILFPMIGDEYIRAGMPTEMLASPVYLFKKQQDYLGGENNSYMNRSYVFDETMSKFKISLASNYEFPINITFMDGYIAEKNAAIAIRTKMYPSNLNPTVCSMPIYSPVGMPGTAEIFLVEGGT
jgi:hypothetical protein